MLPQFARPLDPIPQNSLDQCKRRDCRGIRAQNTRSQGNPHHHWPSQERRPLLLGKPALRADQDRKRLVRMPPRGEESRHGVPHLGCLIAKDQQAIGFCPDLLERHRFGNLRHSKNTALLGRLDRIGAHAIKIDARHLRVTGHNGLQP